MIQPWCAGRNPGAQNGWKSSLEANIPHNIMVYNINFFSLPASCCKHSVVTIDLYAHADANIPCVTFLNKPVAASSQ